MDAIKSKPVEKHRSRPSFKRPREQEIQLAHGSGGSSMHQLVAGLIVPRLGNPFLNTLGDQALFQVNGTPLAFTTDSFVVDPLFFPGGDIGALAVNGTLNDLAMGGAQPLYLSLALILEEGFLMADLERVLDSIRDAAQSAGVEIITGDTKVVHRKCADKLFINTAGIGQPLAGAPGAARDIYPGDWVLVSGTLGDHGMAILSEREGFRFESPIRSDCANLWPLVEGMLHTAPGAIRTMRDPTRGGLATTLNELTGQAGIGIRLTEDSIPVNEPVRAACEMLGLDPLYVANEGKLVAIVAPEHGEILLQAMQAHPLGRDARLIGTVVEDANQYVVLETQMGGNRIVDMLAGDPLPRIC